MAALAAIGFGLTAQEAKAGYLNLTTAGSSGTINGAIYMQGDVVDTNAGTGNFPSFVQVVGNDPIKEAFNSTNSAFDNGNSAQHNFAIQVSQLTTTIIGGQSYFKFILDINENNNATDKYLSLDALQIYTSTTPNQSAPPAAINADGTVSGLGTLRYNMDTVGPPAVDNGVLLDYTHEAGSGYADLSVFIPVFAAAGTDYVYLYSKFGVAGVNPAGFPAGNYGNSDGFEEWAIGVNPVPAPPTVLLIAAGVPALALRRFVRRKKAEA
jgi:hypothetical protein